ncbi:MAG: hypothetical protein ACXVJP_10225 [Mucilaginibacter sp.]
MLKQRLFYNWHIMRIIRLGFGIYLLVWAIQTKDWSIGLFSAFFVLMASTGSGCCGAQGCNSPKVTDKADLQNGQHEIEYEEVK